MENFSIKLKRLRGFSVSVREFTPFAVHDLERITDVLIQNMLISHRRFDIGVIDSVLHELEVVWLPQRSRPNVVAQIMKRQIDNFRAMPCA